MQEISFFSALIYGIAIVLTTGMPVAYSFELGKPMGIQTRKRKWLRPKPTRRKKG
jgi:hypothetical protein